MIKGHSGKKEAWIDVKLFQEISFSKINYKDKYPNNLNLWRKSGHGCHTGKKAVRAYSEVLPSSADYVSAGWQMASAGLLRCQWHQREPNGMWWKYWFMSFGSQILA